MRKFALTLIAALVFDAILFRSGLYASITTTESMQGFGIAVVRALKALPPLPQSGVLLTGDSRMGEGFSASLSNRIAAPQHLQIMNAAVAGTDIRDWYYLLCAIDPKADRYRAIVLSLPTFRAAPPVTGRLDETYHAVFLVPTIGPLAYLDFVGSETDWTSRLNVLGQWLVDPVVYQEDFNDLMTHPAHRWENLQWKRSEGIHMGDEYMGHPETMEGLAYDAEHGHIDYPSRLTPEQRQKLDADFNHPYLNLRAAADAWTSRWLMRIAQHYAGRKTRVYILRMPSTPLPQAIRDDRYTLGAFFQRREPAPNIQVIPEALLLELERPADFFDNRHVDSTGRVALTEKLTNYLIADLAKHPD